MKEGVLKELLTCFPFVPRILEFMDGMTERTARHIVKHSDKAISVSNQEVSVSFVGLVPRNGVRGDDSASDFRRSLASSNRPAMGESFRPDAADCLCHLKVHAYELSPTQGSSAVVFRRPIGSSHGF
jgi:hypothetical protein